MLLLVKVDGEDIMVQVVLEVVLMFLEVMVVEDFMVIVVTELILVDYLKMVSLVVVHLEQ